MLHEAEEQLARATHRHEVYKMALAGMLEAHQQAQVPLREVMQKKASDYLNILSAGRYRLVQGDPENQEIELLVWSNDAGGWGQNRGPSLSRGAGGGVYLAARLALGGGFTRGQPPPLLFGGPDHPL